MNPASLRSASGSIGRSYGKDARAEALPIALEKAEQLIDLAPARGTEGDARVEQAVDRRARAVRHRVMTEGHKGTVHIREHELDHDAPPWLRVRRLCLVYALEALHHAHAVQLAPHHHEHESAWKMRLYHGSYTRIPHPSLNHGRSDIDFGAGFYLTMNYQMAAKWACSKEQSWLNEYDLDEHGLAVKRLSIDDEWLDYVNSNRNRQEVDAPFDDTQYDLIVGPTADDKLFTVVDLYNDGLITKAATLAALSSMADIITTQVVIKTDKAISHLAFLGAEGSLYPPGRDRQARRRAGGNGRHRGQQ